ncbi:ketopantoate reductase family protein [Sporosarcina sp. G11-34]|uniref:ketopantoate reductase family protein n=1 Tax=Sporosarcina sp. G11-34 TaxID=2849605 RepID=UPI0022A97B0C|nr:ketopantoate reductase family protein [Sporosarcina sp. G11-34]MCZ2259652.1 ketopantoate reductase family protein [Sporosarcina sp. G11-34]
MKILVVGAGAIGGYFGARLLENGVNVTFLVREKRKDLLNQTGLNIESIHGNAELIPRLITADAPNETFDLVLISTKSYHLKQAIEDLRPFVNDDTTILPLLNGIAHINLLTEAFGEKAIIGGLCFIETTLDEHGTICQKGPLHHLIFGELSGEETPRIQKLQSVFSGANADFEYSDNINQDMWQKYLFITALSGITSLMESPIGPIMDLESGRNTVTILLEEITMIMNIINAPIKETIASDLFQKISGMGYDLKSSMQRDMEKLLPLEADHLQGFLLQHAKVHNIPVPVLETIYTKLVLYDKSRS